MLLDSVVRMLRRRPHAKQELPIDYPVPSRGKVIRQVTLSLLLAAATIVVIVWAALNKYNADR